MSGWIKLHRSLLDWEWYTDANTMRLFTHLLLTVNYEPKNWRGIDIKRGQIITSVDKLSQQIGLSSQKIRTSLSKLKLTNDITIKTTNRNTLVGITNYEIYQSKSDEVTSQATIKTTNKQQTNNNQITTTKEGKKERTEEQSITASKIPPCPHDEIIDLYHKILPDLQSVKMQLWTGTKREKDLRDRWRQSTDFQDLRFWEWYFLQVKKSRFHMGENERGWKADLAWLIKKENFTKQVEAAIQ